MFWKSNKCPKCLILWVATQFSWPSWGSPGSSTRFWQSSWSLPAFVVEIVVLHCVIPHKTWMRTHVDTTDCTAILGINPLNVHFAGQSIAVCSGIVEVVSIEAEMRDRSCWFWVSFGQPKCPPIHQLFHNSLSECKHFGSISKDLAIRICAFEMLSSKR